MHILNSESILIGPVRQSYVYALPDNNELLGRLFDLHRDIYGLVLLQSLESSEFSFSLSTDVF